MQLIAQGMLCPRRQDNKSVPIDGLENELGAEMLAVALAPRLLFGFAARSLYAQVLVRSATAIAASLCGAFERVAEKKLVCNVLASMRFKALALQRCLAMGSTSMARRLSCWQRICVLLKRAARMQRCAIWNCAL